MGGLGSAVAEVLSESGGASLKRLGLNDTFAQSGDLEQLLDYYGFNVRDLVNTITEEIKNAKTLIKGSIMLKTAIIGAGDISKPHAKAISDLGIGIAGVLDYNSARSKELADKYGGKVIQKLDEVLDEVDMVHIFTPPSQRVEYVRKAAEAGKHIFIEKPIAISIEDAREIVSLAKEYKV